MLSCRRSGQYARHIDTSLHTRCEETKEIWKDLRIQKGYFEWWCEFGEERCSIVPILVCLALIQKRSRL